MSCADGLRVLAQRRQERVAQLLRLGLVLLELVGLGHRPPQPQPDQAEHAAEQERDAPAEAGELLGGEDGGEQRAEERRDQHGAARGDVEERRVTAPACRRRDLGQVRRGVRDLTAQRHALPDARQQQQDRGEPSHQRERRQDADDERPARHQEDRQQHRRAPAPQVGVPAQQPAAERAEEERQRIGGQRAEQRERGVLRREDLGGEEDAERRVDRPVVPLDRVADRRCHQGADGQPMGLALLGSGGCRGWVGHGCSRTGDGRCGEVRPPGRDRHPLGWRRCRLVIDKRQAARVSPRAARRGRRQGGPWRSRAPRTPRGRRAGPAAWPGSARPLPARAAAAAARSPTAPPR